MNLRAFLEALVRRRPEAATYEQVPSLREFAYLDDISVYSLLASIRGALPSEYTDTNAADVTTAHEAGLEGGVLLGKADARTKATSSRTTTSQVVRRSSVQSAFRDLHASVASQTLALRKPGNQDTLPHSLEPDGHWVLDARTLDRGRLIEAEIELQTDFAFRFHAVISAFVEMFDEGLDEFTAVDEAELERLRALTRLLDRLMTGLVPIRGRVADWFVVTRDEKVLVAHRRVVDGLDIEVAALPLYVVGVAEQRLFWRDIRRVGFSNSSYRIFGRVARSGVLTTWTPLKLLDVIRDVLPQVEGQLTQAIGAEAFQALAAGAAAGTAGGDQADVQLRVAAEVFIGGIAGANGREVSEVDRTELLAKAFRRGGDLSSVEAIRQFFGPLTVDIDRRLGIEIQPQQEADWRLAAVQAAGVGLGAAPTPTPGPAPRIALEERYLETEIIGLYW